MWYAGCSLLWHCTPCTVLPFAAFVSGASGVPCWIATPSGPGAAVGDGAGLAFLPPDEDVVTAAMMPPTASRTTTTAATTIRRRLRSAFALAACKAAALSRRALPDPLLGVDMGEPDLRFGAGDSCLSAGGTRHPCTL